jgi:hypothetical protein
VQEKYDYLGSVDTTNAAPTGLFWTDIFRPAPSLTASRWVLWTLPLVALLASCKESTDPHSATASIVAVGNKTLIDTVGATVTVTVRVTGSDVGGVPVSFTVTAGGGSVNPALTTTDQAGMATGVWTLGKAAGTGSDGLIATSGTLPAVEFSATTTPGEPVALKVLAGNSQAGFFFLPIPDRPTVMAVDRFGNPAFFSGTNVHFSVSAGGGSFSGGCCAAGEIVSHGGLAGTIIRPNDDWVLSGMSATQTLTATSPGLVPAVISATAAAAPIPSDADWTQLAAQFAAIAVDAIAQLNTAPTFVASYKCCNVLAATSNAFAASAATVNVTVQRSSTLDASGTGSISVTETITEGAAPADSTCFGNCDLPFTATHALNLPSPGLTVSGVLSVVNGIVGAVQQLHLTGSIVYYSGTTGPSALAASANVTFHFNGSLQGPVIPTGLFGVALSNSTLPSVPSPNRADLSVYPRLVSMSDVGEPIQEDYLGPPGTSSTTTATDQFWTRLSCPGPQMTAVGGAMADITIATGVAWPAVSPDYGYAGYVTVSPAYQVVPNSYSNPPTLAAGQSLFLSTINVFEPYWGLFGPSASGTRTPWNAIFRVSYTVKSTGQKATYTLAYSCQ